MQSADEKRVQSLGQDGAREFCNLQDIKLTEIPVIKYFILICEKRVSRKSASVQERVLVANYRPPTEGSLALEPSTSVLNRGTHIFRRCPSSTCKYIRLCELMNMHARKFCHAQIIHPYRHQVSRVHFRQVLLHLIEKKTMTSCRICRISSMRHPDFNNEPDPTQESSVVEVNYCQDDRNWLPDTLSLFGIGQILPNLDRIRTKKEQKCRRGSERGGDAGR
ncbi:hypothetical protein Zmor_009655 [Zophobas morio]|uniref:Uncharacterized protein n=1 Tax=Zophobas morio TaxID=2755281 RepID=A0AA38MJ24_9CUCU|nr:hypothetical protein Zmor_009655 [Zophobas morio]